MSTDPQQETGQRTREQERWLAADGCPSGQRVEVDAGDLRVALAHIDLANRLTSGEQGARERLLAALPSPAAPQPETGTAHSPWCPDRYADTGAPSRCNCAPTRREVPDGPPEGFLFDCCAHCGCPAGALRGHDDACSHGCNDVPAAPTDGGGKA